MGSDFDPTVVGQINQLTHDAPAGAPLAASGAAPVSGCVSLHELRARGSRSRLPTEFIDVPGIGRLLVRGLTYGDIDEAERAATRVVDPRTGQTHLDVGAKLKFMLIRALVEPQVSMSDLDLFEGWTVGQFDAAFAAVNRLSGIEKPKAGDRTPFSSAPGSV